MYINFMNFKMKTKTKICDMITLDNYPKSSNDMDMFLLTRYQSAKHLETTVPNFLFLLKILTRHEKLKL